MQDLFKSDIGLKVVQYNQSDKKIKEQVDTDRRKRWFQKYSDQNQVDSYDCDGTCTIALLYGDIVIGGCRLLQAEEIAKLPMGVGLVYRDERYSVVTEVSRLYIQPSRIPPALQNSLRRFTLFNYLVIGLERLTKFEPLPYTYALINEYLLKKCVPALGISYEIIGPTQIRAGYTFLPVKLHRRKVFRKPIYEERSHYKQCA